MMNNLDILVCQLQVLLSSKMNHEKLTDLSTLIHIMHMRLVFTLLLVEVCRTSNQSHNNLHINFKFQTAMALAYVHFLLLKCLHPHLRNLQKL